MPNFWERRERSGMLRDMRKKPDRYAWIENAAPLALNAPQRDDVFEDAAIEAMLAQLERG